MAPRVPHIFIDGVEHKKCCRCKQQKIIGDYSKNPRAWDKLLARCKKCDCNRVKNSLKKPENRKRRREYDHEYSRSEKGKKRDKKYRESQNGREKRREQKTRHRLKWRKDPIWKLRQYTSARAWEMYHKQGLNKSESVLKMFGCSVLKVHCHIESKFDFYMTPNNAGKYGWHIDHIIPVSSWDLTHPVERKVSFWYKNLQPMWGSDNIRKRDTYKEEDKQALIKEWIFYNI